MTLGEQSDECEYEPRVISAITGRKGLFWTRLMQRRS
jgi:hypothetical protein